MGYTNVPIAANGDWIDPAYINTNLGDNFRALAPYSATGDLGYWDNVAKALIRMPLTPGGLLIAGASTPNWLGKPARGILQHDGTNPSWLEFAAGQARRYLQVNAAGTGLQFAGGPLKIFSFENSTSYSTNYVTWRDVPNSSLNITVDVTSTVIVLGGIVQMGTSNFAFHDVVVHIDGTDISAMQTSRTYGINNVVTMPLVGIKTGVAAGTRTIKLREQVTADGVTVSRKFYIVLVVPE